MTKWCRGRNENTKGRRKIDKCLNLYFPFQSHIENSSCKNKKKNIVKQNFSAKT